MDFTPELSAFQGVILSADNTHDFSKITARGGRFSFYLYDQKLDFFSKTKTLVINKICNFSSPA